MDIRKKIARAIYIGAGGNPKQEFDTADEVYVEVDKLFDASGNKIVTEQLDVNITTNGNYSFNEPSITGYKPVNIDVNVDVGTAYDDGYNAGIIAQKSKLETIEITSNGTYTKEDGYNEVKVDVPQKYTDEQVNDLQETARQEGYGTGYDTGFEDGVIDQKEKLETIEITSNGTYTKEDGYNEVKVKIKGSGSFDFTELGYDDDTNNILNADIQSDIDYSLSVKDKLGDKTVATRLFEDDVELKYCPYFDTSKVTRMDYMLKGCKFLIYVPYFDTSSCTNMTDMFNNCNLLLSVPQLDTSKVTNMNYMFSGCSTLITIPQLDTSKVTDMTSTFYGCNSLTTIPLLECGNVNNVGYLTGIASNKKLTNLGGFKDLGKQPKLSNNIGSYFLESSPLTYESIMNVINNLYDRKSAGYDTITIKLGSTNLAKISDEEKAIATNKGWTLT